MSKKEKVKEFAKKNWKTIAIGTIGVGLCAVGFLAGRKTKGLITSKLANSGKTTGNMIPYDEVIRAALIDACNTHPGPHVTFGKRFDVPVTAKELGKLGEAMVSCSDYNPDTTFTHFIAIGGDVINKT